MSPTAWNMEWKLSRTRGLMEHRMRKFRLPVGPILIPSYIPIIPQIVQKLKKQPRLALTLFPCPVSVLMHSPVLVFHSLIVLSKEPLAKRLSWSKLMLQTLPPCPVNVLIRQSEINSKIHLLITWYNLIPLPFINISIYNCFLRNIFL